MQLVYNHILVLVLLPSPSRVNQHPFHRREIVYSLKDELLYIVILQSSIMLDCQNDIKDCEHTCNQQLKNNSLSQLKKHH